MLTTLAPPLCSSIVNAVTVNNCVSYGVVTFKAPGPKANAKDLLKINTK